MDKLNLEVCGGCNAKIAAGSLDEILSSINNFKRDDILIGYDNKDDSAVIKINNESGIISTVDFFPPMVSDPYVFGQIAAANALSDVYAMGGDPICALNLVCFPEDGNIEVLKKILQGGSNKIIEAKSSLVGGHSIHDSKIKYGLSVTGKVDIDKIWSNHTPKTGDMLILTKPLGVTLVTNAYGIGIVDEKIFNKTVNSMTFLNMYAKNILEKYKITSATDITGFGFLGHLGEMLTDKYTAIIDSKKIPILDGARLAASEFVFTKGGQRNRNFMQDKVEFQVKDFELEEILYDPQTSGGLLVSVAKEDSQKALEELKNNNIDAEIVGQVYDKFDKSIFIV